MHNNHVKSSRPAEPPRPGPRVNPGASPRRKLAGFTLIELVIAIAVVAILTVIALPSYQNQIRKSQRTAARNALLDLASREEKFYALNNSYTTDAAALGYATAFPIAVPGDGTTYYNMTVALVAGFTGTATRAGSQANDSCGDYTLNSLGQQTPTTAGCW